MASLNHKTLKTAKLKNAFNFVGKKLIKLKSVDSSSVDGLTLERVCSGGNVTMESTQFIGTHDIHQRIIQTIQLLVRFESVAPNDGGRRMW